MTSARPSAGAPGGAGSCRGYRRAHEAAAKPRRSEIMAREPRSVGGVLSFVDVLLGRIASIVEPGDALGGLGASVAIPTLVSHG